MCPFLGASIHRELGLLRASRWNFDTGLSEPRKSPYLSDQRMGLAVIVPKGRAKLNPCLMMGDGQEPSAQTLGPHVEVSKVSTGKSNKAFQ